MKRYDVHQQISAPIEGVWQALTQTMPENPAPFGILRLEGRIAPGARLRIWSQVAPKRAFALRVIRLERPGLMVWQGGMPFGLFTGTRRFTLVSQDNGTMFHMQEGFTGPLSGLITRSMPDLTDSFRTFALALKSKAEAS